MSEKRRKYRLALLEDLTLREVFHFRVSLLGAISVLTISLVVIILLLSVLIVYTPIRNILPGYSESLRQQLIQESARVDSLQSTLSMQRQYLEVIRQITAGDIQSDSVQRLDSMEMVIRAQMVEERNAVTDAFMAQYEQKERDRLVLLASSSNPIRQLYRPVRGAIMSPARPDQRVYATTIRTAKNENVLAVTRGTILSSERMADNTFAIVLQAGSFVAVYRHVGTVLKPQGTNVEKGESVGLMDGEHDLEIELWEEGQFVDFEEKIVF